MKQMKQSKDLLLGVLNLGVWASLYILGYGERTLVIAIGLVLLSYCLVAWVENNGRVSKCLALFLANILFSYSLFGFKVPFGFNLLSGILGLAFSLSYFFQWNSFRLKSFQLFSKRRDKILSGIFSALVFGISLSLFAPTFPTIDRAFLAALSNLITTHYDKSALFFGLYSMVLFAVPTIRIGEK